MSYDRQLEQVCPHLVVDEALYLDSNRLTARPLRPISSALSTKVRLNGVLNVPSAGTKIPAIGKGALPGPYNIKAGVNDLLIVSVDDRTPQTVTLPAGKGLSAIDVARALTRLVSGATFTTTRKNQVQGQSNTEGRSSKLVYRTGSTLASSLGFSVNRGYQGQVTCPGWALVVDPNTLSDRPTRLVLFDEPLSGTSEYVEVSYATVRQECRRCGGSGVENDWRYDTSGMVVKVRNADLLIQEVQKATYTVKGSNQFHLWYGTGLLEAIGTKFSTNGLVQNLILSEIQDVFRRWQSIKKQQEEVVGQTVSDEEYPFRLLVVNLEPDADDPTVVFVNTIVQNRSSQPINISKGLRLPLPLDILGSTVQDALLRENNARTQGLLR